MKEMVLNVYRKHIDGYGWVNMAFYDDFVRVFGDVEGLYGLVGKYSRLMGLEFKDGIISSSGNISIDKFAEIIATMIEKLNEELKTVVRIEKVIIP